MTVESATYTSGLNASNPASGDPFIEGDDHIRLLKSTIKATFPNITGAVTATQGDLNTLTGAAGVVVLSSSGIGYGVGAGGSVTQTTSKTTAVTLNKPCGSITMHNAALAAGATVIFGVNNSLVSATDFIGVTARGFASGGTYIVSVDNIYAGGFAVSLKNISAGTLTESLAIGFAIIKGTIS